MRRTDVVVVTKDRSDLIHRLYVSLFAQDAPINVILWDNGTDEETQRLARMWHWDRGTVGRNLSYSEALNRAARMGSSDEIVFVNNDAVFDPHALDELLACDRPEPIIGTLNYHADGTVNHAGVNFAGFIPAHVGRGEPLEAWAGRECAAWPATTFAVVRVQRAVWERLGGLDEQYWYGFEDTDFCLRAAELGYGTAVCYRARIRHEEFGTRTREHDKVNMDRFLETWIYTDRAVPALERVRPRT